MRLPDIKRGRMTAAEKAELHRLAETLKKPTPSVIARRLNRHPATVKWHMLRNGLLSQKPGYLARSYSVNGVTRHPWSPEQDHRLEKILADGGNYRQAGEILTAEFGIRRTGHSCQIRAVMLAASDEDAAA